jgi:hypothetical protein
MMVKVLGISGVDGVYSGAASLAMEMMKRGQAALSVFVNLFDGESEEAFERVRERLREEKDVKELIASATNRENLWRMPADWWPHW